MPAKTLVIVDMQPIFEASRNPNTVIAVAHEIIVARQNNHPVIFLEYAKSGSTYDGFGSLLKNYPHKSRIKKNDDDGSKEVIRALNRRNFPMQILRICGVNTDCCVHSTITGLLRHLDDVKIEVVKNACNSETKNFNWSYYYKHPNLRLI
jgi:nicotinamidase-related amidase